MQGAHDALIAKTLDLLRLDRKHLIYQPLRANCGRKDANSGGFLRTVTATRVNACDAFKEKCDRTCHAQGVTLSTSCPASAPAPETNRSPRARRLRSAPRRDDSP